MSWATIPNALTFGRIVLAVWVVIICVNLPGDEFTDLQRWVILILLTIGAVTDYADGYIARRWPSQWSALGEYLDPPADKLFVAAVMLYIAVTTTAFGWFEAVCFLLIIVREIAMVGLRTLATPAVCPVSQLGKYKTAVQMTALLLYVLAPVVPTVYVVAAVALLVATVLTVWSFVEYLRVFLGKTAAVTE